MSHLEHINITVSNSKLTADLLCDLFDWKVRWHGPAMNEGYTYHVGTDESYVAIYKAKTKRKADNTGEQVGTLNHIEIMVDDLDATQARITAKGYETHNHGDYEPGRRFYFHDNDGIEYEVISYEAAQ